MTTKKEYYNKRLLYRDHYHLRLMKTSIEREGKKIRKRSLMLLGFIFFLNIIGEQIPTIEFYPEALLSLEVTVLIMYLIYNLFIKKLIYKGKVTAYFRRDYTPQGKVMVFIGKRVKGIVFRASIVLSYFAVSVMLGGFTNDMLLSIMQRMFNPNIVVPLVIFGLFSFYFMFYQDRYITIRNYSNKVTNNIKRGMNEEKAFMEFINKRDKELGISSFNGYYYDKDDKKRSKYSKENLDFDLSFLDNLKL